MKLQTTACCFLPLVLAGCMPLRPDAATAPPADVVTVRYGQYEVDFQQPNPDAGLPQALRACSAKGYPSATRLGGPSQECDISLSFAGCYHWVITQDYKCGAAA